VRPVLDRIEEFAKAKEANWWHRCGSQATTNVGLSNKTKKGWGPIVPVRSLSWAM
jgi:hypothetical protein